jgi:hypothetical protein
MISISLSLHGSKHRGIELLEDLSRTRRSSCDEEPDISKKSKNLHTGMAREVIHQEDGISVSTKIKISQIATIGKGDHAVILTQHRRLAIWRCTSF